jgi:hypothetical protein
MHSPLSLRCSLAGSRAKTADSLIHNQILHFRLAAGVEIHHIHLTQPFCYQPLRKCSSSPVYYVQQPGILCTSVQVYKFKLQHLQIGFAVAVGDVDKQNEAQHEEAHCHATQPGLCAATHSFGLHSNQLQHPSPYIGQSQCSMPPGPQERQPRAETTCICLPGV